MANSLLQKQLQAQATADRDSDSVNDDDKTEKSHVELKKPLSRTASEETQSLVQNAEDLALNDLRPLEASKTCLEEGAEEVDEAETKLKVPLPILPSASKLPDDNSLNSSKYQHNVSNFAESRIIGKGYECFGTIVDSDHRPVRAVFTIRGQEIDEARRIQTLESLAKLYEQQLANAIPKLHCVSGELNFGQISVGQTKAMLAIFNIENWNSGKQSVFKMVCPDPLIGLVSCDQQSLEKNELGAQSLLTKIILRPNETFIRTRRIAAFSQEFNNFVLIFRINNVLNGIEVNTDVAVPLSFQL